MVYTHKQVIKFLEAHKKGKLQVRLDEDGWFNVSKTSPLHILLYNLSNGKLYRVEPKP